MLEIRQLKIRSEKVLTLSGSPNKFFVSPCSKCGTIFRPPRLDRVKGAVHSFDPADALFCNAQGRRQVEVHDARSPLEIEPFVHRVRAQRDSSAFTPKCEAPNHFVSLALTARGHHHLGRVDTLCDEHRFED
jgi:hypothetical protein